MSLDKYDTLEKMIALARALEVPDAYIESQLWPLSQGFVDRINNAENRLYEIGLGPEPKMNDFVLTLEMLREHAREMLLYACQDQIALRRARRDIAGLVNDDGNAETRKWFVTANFDDTVVVDSNEATVINNFCDRVITTSGFNVIAYVPEKFREGGSQIHRHVHFIIESEYKKSKVIQYMFQKVPKVGRDKLLAISSKAFLDVKKWETYHDKYVRGEKRDEKLDCIDMDRVWRSEKGIKSLF